VSRWMSIHVETEVLPRLVNIVSAPYFGPLPEQADRFYRQELGLPKYAPFSMVIQHALNVKARPGLLQVIRETLDNMALRTCANFADIVMGQVNEALDDCRRTCTNIVPVPPLPPPPEVPQAGIDGADALPPQVTQGEGTSKELEGPQDDGATKKRVFAEKGTKSLPTELKESVKTFSKKGDRKGILPLLVEIERSYAEIGPRQLNGSERKIGQRNRSLLASFQKCVADHPEAFYATTTPIKTTVFVCQCKGKKLKNIYFISLHVDGLFCKV